jgi:hypothetical protein
MARGGHVQCPRRRTLLAYDFTRCVDDRTSLSSLGESAPLPPPGALNGESDNSRDNIMDILLPLTFAWFRVRPFLSFSPLPFFQPRSSLPSPLLQYSFTEQGFDPHTLLYGSYSTPRSSHHAHPPDPLSPVSIDYLGHALRLQLPAIALSASLAYFARLDAFPLSPVSREPGQIDSPTVEDIEFTSQSFRTRTVPRGPGFPDSDLPIGSVSPSARHDWDWLRGVAEGFSGSLRRYTPGILAGKWRGTALVRLLRVQCCALNICSARSLFLMPTRLALGTIRS